MFPSQIPVKEIKRTAGEYDEFVDAYVAFRDLFEGGARLKRAVVNRGLYLLKKPKELAEVYATRQLRFTYTNVLGNIVGWYIAALFEHPPQLIKRADGVQGEKALQLPKEAADFCAEFEEDCDGAGATFVDFWRAVFRSLILNRTAYVLVDIPAPSADMVPLTLRDQQAAGALDAYLTLYDPSQVINWDTDSYGNLLWCVITICVEERTFLQEPVKCDYWYYFDREQVALYRSERKTQGEDGFAFLVEGYPRRHAMADQQRVPVRKIEVDEGMWLANRAYLLLLNHLNLDNAFDFGLFNAALAQLVITDGESGAYEEPVTISEVSYHHLPHGGTMEYLEPEGRSFDTIDKRLQSLEERIYKSAYLQDQARTNRSTPAAQSGLSKQLDKMPSGAALSAFGDVVRPAMQLIYNDVLQIRGLTDIVPDVRGFDFTDKASSEEMDFMEKSTVIDVQSDTYRRERDKRFVRVVLADANPETLDKIDEEIDANPTPEGAAQQQQEAQRASQLASFKASLQGAGQ